MKKMNSILLILLIALTSYILAENTDNFQVQRHISLCNGSFEPGGSGSPDNAGLWIRIADAFSPPGRSWLKDNDNNGNYKLAILDTGLDAGTYRKIIIDYAGYITIRLFDEDGNYVPWYDGVDKLQAFHHGSFITSLIVQILEGNSNDVEADIGVFTIADDYGAVDKDIIESQLLEIKQWNLNNPNNKYKVITTSYKDEYAPRPDYMDLVDYLVEEQDCIFIAASGNYGYQSQGNSALENTLLWPSRGDNVIGVGGIYAYNAPEDHSDKMIHRMTTAYPDFTDPSFITGSYFVGSCYKDDVYLPKASVELVAPGFKVESYIDMDSNPYDVDNYIATGTSFSSPQVAVAAYLAARARYHENPTNPLTYHDFIACIVQSSENDPEGRLLPTSQRKYHNEVGAPTANLFGYTTYFTYRVGYGSLDIGDMIEYIFILS